MKIHVEKAEREPLNFQIHPPSEKYLEKYEKKKKIYKK
jgi:hypothetical protein